MCFYTMSVILINYNILHLKLQYFGGYFFISFNRQPNHIHKNLLLSENL